jgi:1,2-diacylglycerol 3-beta-galactosyltransferase
VTSDTPEVVVFFIDAGGGHRAAANALLAAAVERPPPFALRAVSLGDVLKGLDFAPLLTGRSFEENYNVMIRRGWTRFLVPMLRCLHGLIFLLRRPLSRAVARHLRERPPAAVVSVTPNFNAVIRDGVRQLDGHVPFITLLTDYADFPPHFWIEDDVDRVIVGSAEAVVQALTLRVPRSRISRTSGMLLHPRFYAQTGPGTRVDVRRELGIPDDAFVALLLFGGKGAPEMEPLARELLAAAPALQVVAICGDNPGLQQRLDAAREGAGGRLHVLGFTDRVAQLMAASDVLVTKPGPGTLAEAFHERLPVIVVSNRLTVPQERFNARMLESRRLGIVVGHWREIPGHVARLAADAAALAELREALMELPENQAVYEALDLIAAELQRFSPRETSLPLAAEA